VSPRIESTPGTEHREAWVRLSEAEARQLLEALEYWDDEESIDPGWHHHIKDAEGRELTIAIVPADTPLA
jgi:hypothetical protein